MARSYGVLRALGLFAARHTFYIGVDGKILFVDRRVRTGSAGTDLAGRLHTLGVRRR